MLSHEDQKKIINIVLTTMNHADLIVGGDFALKAHELRDNAESDQVCFYHTGEVVREGMFGDSCLKRTRERIRNAGFSKSHLYISQAPRLQYHPTVYVNGPYRTRVLSFEDTIRLKIDRCSDRSEGRGFRPGDFHDLYQIKEKLGKFGIDGFFASRIDHLNTDDFCANLRRTWADLLWNDKIAVYTRGCAITHSPEEVLAGLRALERDELPITKATIQLSRAIESKSEGRIVDCQTNLTKKVLTALHSGFQPTLLPSTQHETDHIDRPVNPVSQAADIAKNVIDTYKNFSVDAPGSDLAQPGVYGVPLVPHFDTGAVLGPLGKSSISPDVTSSGLSGRSPGRLGAVKSPVIWGARQIPLHRPLAADSCADVKWCDNINSFPS
ncbi:hypothetical protein ACFW9I_36110 [[Kitasatospora] papulosa]|uniref:hypothetical protein n=1 Tax=[Kitasatospora] papulosa TaxID=1464011 RepID=UPI0036C64BF6